MNQQNEIKQLEEKVKFIVIDGLSIEELLAWINKLEPFANKSDYLNGKLKDIKNTLSEKEAKEKQSKELDGMVFKPSENFIETIFEDINRLKGKTHDKTVNEKYNDFTGKLEKRAIEGNIQNPEEQQDFKAKLTLKDIIGEGKL